MRIFAWTLLAVLVATAVAAALMLGAIMWGLGREAFASGKPAQIALWTAVVALTCLLLGFWTGSWWAVRDYRKGALAAARDLGDVLRSERRA